MSEEQKRVSLFESRDWPSPDSKWKPFNNQISILNKAERKLFGQRFRLDLFDFEILGEVLFVLIL